MLKIKTLLLSFLMFSLTGFGQKSHRTIDQFFYFLNTYQKDSLQLLVADNFILSRTYISAGHDKESFLTTYLSNSKAVNGKFTILKTISHNPEQFLAEDESDYLKYLGIQYPSWKITINISGNKVDKMIIDTTETTQQYLEDAKQKSEDFDTWLGKEYPGETVVNLYRIEGLLIKRLKEYVKKK